MEELLREKVLWIATFICFVGIVLGIPFFDMKIPMETGSFIQLFQKALQTKLLLFLIPVASVLPLGASYVRESSSGFLKFYVTRISRVTYVRRKTLLIYGGGFLPFFFGGVCALLLCFLCFYPLEYQGILPWEKVLEAFVLLLRVALIGGVIAEISGIFAAVFQNYYMAYGLPFVCFYMLIILKERYLPEMYAIYPAEWIVCEQDWGTDENGIWAFLLVFSIVSMLLHKLALQQRLQEI